MSASSLDRSRHCAAAASVLTLIALVVGVLVLAVGVDVPQAWWPHTGQAFAADARPADQDPCDLIVGPAKDYCERGTPTTTSASERPDGSGAAWRLVPAGAGLTALMVWRRRSAAGQRRR
ncbi:hypothetical protein [Streptomyces europaeiscabiei]|uniref:hypothetical protein n=1 Tax=Streptomyces europaeiscabiei TaxID=146819 RepID=UPI000765AC3B|nr:hypothetical protein [Streptomyces europaeiscabiei]